METFKAGDKVVYLREPTSIEWSGIGKVPIPFSIGAILEVSSIDTNSIKVKEDTSNHYSYPTVVFKLFTAIKYPARGDYIVTVKGNFIEGSCGKENYCFKVRDSTSYLRPSVDLHGSNGNGHAQMSWDLSRDLKEWRYATDIEIAEYDRLKKPFDITNIKNTPTAGDYIVTVRVTDQTHNCGRNNYCFKLRTTNVGVYPCIDLRGSTNNGHDYMSWDLQHYLLEWRFATPEEITEYDRLGKPYNVFDLKKGFPKKDDYIVTLEGDFGTTYCGKMNYCFKIREAHSFIRPYVDLFGQMASGTTTMCYDLSSKLKKWRFASEEEIKEYNRIGKPYDVTQIKTVIMPKKGDYIVILELTSVCTDCAKVNYCFKVRENHPYLRPCKDLSGDTSNGHSGLMFDLSDDLLAWRYATSSEISKYNFLEKPFNVTEFSIPKYPYKFKVGDLVETVWPGSGIKDSELGKLVTITEIGRYNGEAGYKVSPAIGNTKNGHFDGFIGEKSFKLYEEEKVLSESIYDSIKDSFLGERKITPLGFEVSYDWAISGFPYASPFFKPEEPKKDEIKVILIDVPKI